MSDNNSKKKVVIKSLSVGGEKTIARLYLNPPIVNKTRRRWSISQQLGTFYIKEQTKKWFLKVFRRFYYFNEYK